MKNFLNLIYLLFTCICLSAQTLPVAKNYQDAYDKNTRSNSGKPGIKYWQNTANYNIDISFSPASRIIAGKEEISYTNNSPDTLNFIVFKLYPNYYKKGVERDQRIKAEDESDGVRIESLMVNDSTKSTDDIKISGTNMFFKVPVLLPGRQMKFNLQFSYELNKTSHNRTGMVDDSAAFVAYFFPRIAVYDDIDGWNGFAYTGTQEFYNDFCSFNVNVSVPKNYIVCATGNLLNADEVYAPQIAQRIGAAEQSDAVTKVIDTTDLQNGNITAQNAVNTWKFKADSVTDFVFATSWVWKKWFYDGGIPDLAIANVKQSAKQTTVTVSMKGSKPVPVHLTVYYKDGTTQILHETIVVWENSNSTTLNFTSTKAIDKIVLGDVHDADADDSNNVWEAK